MRSRSVTLALGLVLLGAGPAGAQVTGGVMRITGAEMH
jgi:hypothetical protein